MIYIGDVRKSLTYNLLCIANVFHPMSVLGSRDAYLLVALNIQDSMKTFGAINTCTLKHVCREHTEYLHVSQTVPWQYCTSPTF